MPGHQGESSSKVLLPITPMLDMTFQLLFFFIINFHPADVEGQIDMALPMDNGGRIIWNGKKESPELPNDFPADLTVKVRTQGGENSQGGIVGLFVASTSGKDEPVPTLEALQKFLEDKRAASSNKEGIKVMGDSKLRIKHLMRVMDVCRRAGFEKVSMIADEDFGR